MTTKNLIFYSDGTVWQIVHIAPPVWDKNGQQIGGGGPVLEQVC